jgi:hypothetical protein
MKTPRDILMARHQVVTPKLDDIRRSVVEKLNNKETKEQSFPAALVSLFLGCLNKSWLELIWPCRRTWAGLAAVWVLLAVINMSQRDRSSAVMAKSATPTAMLLTFRDQQKMLNELFADHALPGEAVRPRSFSPKPRTETMSQEIV